MNHELDLMDIVFSLLIVGCVYGFGWSVGRFSQYRHNAKIRKELEDDDDSARSYRGADGHE